MLLMKKIRILDPFCAIICWSYGFYVFEIKGVLGWGLATGLICVQTCQHVRICAGGVSVRGRCVRVVTVGVVFCWGVVPVAWTVCVCSQLYALVLYFLEVHLFWTVVCRRVWLSDTIGSITHAHSGVLQV